LLFVHERTLLCTGEEDITIEKMKKMGGMACENKVQFTKIFF